MGRGEGTLRGHIAKQGLVWHDPPGRTPRLRKRRALPPRDPRQIAIQLRWLADHGWSKGKAAIELDIADTRAWRLSKREFGIDWTVRFRSVKGQAPPRF